MSDELDQKNQQRQQEEEQDKKSTEEKELTDEELGEASGGTFTLVPPSLPIISPITITGKKLQN
jgi:hypothetical protein